MSLSKSKSIIIKINNSMFLDYLYFKLLLKTKSNKKIYISKNRFSKYSNIIIHLSNIKIYDELFDFINLISDILTNCIIKFYTYPLLIRILNHNFFYFSISEQVTIIHNTIKELNTLIFECFSYIYPNIYSYIYNNLLYNQHTSLYITGFVNFRLKKYNNFLNIQLEKQIQNFILEKEYLNLINLLQEYIEITPPKTNLIHVVFTKNSICLLNSNYSIIPINNTLNNYISDFTFSNHDKILNTLLTLLPKNIIFHILYNKDNIYNDFIQSLELIFKDRIHICDCNNCKLCKMHNKI